MREEYWPPPAGGVFWFLFISAFVIWFPEIVERVLVTWGWQ